MWGRDGQFPKFWPAQQTHADVHDHAHSVAKSTMLPADDKALI